MGKIYLSKVGRKKMDKNTKPLNVRLKPNEQRSSIKKTNKRNGKKADKKESSTRI